MQSHSAFYRSHVLKRLPLALAVLFLVTACGRNQPPKDLENYVTSLQKPVATMVFDPKLPVPRTYQAGSLRSPFESIQATSRGPATNQLQAYPVTMLRFAGTVSGTSGTVAYVLTPDNLVYQVKVGDKMGDHDGKVILIEPGQLRLSEKEQEAGKPVTEHIVTLQLKDEH